MGNFKGWLIAFGGVELPNSFLLKGGFKSNPNQRIQREAYRDESPQVLLHIETADGTKSKITLKIRELTLEEREAFDAVIGIATLGYTEKKQRKVRVKYWNDDLGVLDYREGDFYIADPEFTIKTVDEEEGNIHYESFTLTLVEF